MKTEKTIYKELEQEYNYKFLLDVMYNLNYPKDKNIINSFELKFKALTEEEKEQIFIDHVEKQLGHGMDFDMSWFDFFAKELCIKDTYQYKLQSKNTTIFQELFRELNQDCEAICKITDWIIDNIPNMEQDYKKMVFDNLFSTDYNGSSDRKYFNSTIYKAFKTNFFKDFEDEFIKKIIERKDYNTNKDDFFEKDFFRTEIKQFPGFDKILSTNAGIKAIIHAHIHDYIHLNPKNTPKNEKDFESLQMEDGYTMAPSIGHRAMICLERLIYFIEENNTQFLFETPHKEIYNLKIDLLYSSFVIEHRGFCALNNMEYDKKPIPYPNTEKLIEMCNLKEQKNTILEGFRAKFDNINDTSLSVEEYNKKQESVDNMIKNSVILGFKNKTTNKTKI